MPADTDAELDDVMAWLRGKADRAIETHIAAVFLIGDEAYKLKKAVDLGFLDFSTRDKRAWAVRRELDFNRKTAPDIYLGVSRVTRADDGSLALDGEGEPLECVLRMRRFDPEAVLSNRPERVNGDFAEALGRKVAGLHAEAEVRPGGAEALHYVIRSNARHLRSLAQALGGEEVEALIAATQAEFDRRRALLETRGQDGQLRRCHGDLHLANILEEDGRAIPFDCIEFNDTLSEIDVLYDLAFLLMDLDFRGNAGGSNRVLNGYLDEAARSFGEAPLNGLILLPLFLSVRAGVRAHVNGHNGDHDAARAYVRAALDHLRWPAPELYAVGGLSGSGKSTEARKVAPSLGAPPGAVILRSDEIRKRLWGRRPTEPLPPEAYAAEESGKVYGRMLHEAALVLAAGRPAILDAVFLKPEERAAAEQAAADAGVPFHGLWLDTQPEVMAERVAARTGDASDADAKVLEQQLRRDPGAMTWERRGQTERLFCYGTLQQEDVQLATFGRRLAGRADVLPGFKRTLVRITDPEVLAKSGQEFHPIVAPSEYPSDRVEGTVFEITPEELAHADRYEVDDYARVAVTLGSGLRAWVYIEAGAAARISSAPSST